MVSIPGYVVVISLALLIFPRKPSVSVLGTLVRDGLGADDLVRQEIEGTRCLDRIEHAPIQGAIGHELEAMMRETLAVPVMSWLRLL